MSTASTIRRRHGSAFEGPASLTDPGDLNFAQRLLMANENAVTNIADLWVAAAMNVDNDETFEPEQDLLDMHVDSEYIKHEDIPSSITSSPVHRRLPFDRLHLLPAVAAWQNSRLLPTTP
jgi:hypothetical protein